MTHTSEQYDEVAAHCRELFVNKTHDYGTAWRILRLPSLTDQIFIKAKRIRSIQERGKQQVQDSILDEFKGIVNYCIMALIQIQASLEENKELELSVDEVSELYRQMAEETRELLANKNHDYGEAWRDMRIASITDIILMKLLRVKQIERNKGVTIASEGIKANYQDMLNYAVFALIKINEGEDPVHD